MDSNNYRVEVTDAFADDIEEAVTYCETQSGKQSAARFLQRYDSFLELVFMLPGHGSLIGDSGLRWRQLGVFIAVYQVDEAGSVVTLLRLYHLSTNWRYHILGSSE